MKKIKSLKEYQEIDKEKRKFVYLETRAMDEIVVSESNEKMIKIEKDFTDFKLFLEPTNEYGLRESVLNKIKEASALLPEGIYFMLYSGFRPIEIQQKLYDEIYKDISEKNPELNREELWDEVTQFIADPKGTPPHSTGGAVDLTLCDKNGIELDMGGKVDEVEHCYTFDDNISDEAKKNRELLFSVMEKVGMVNIPTEWWHFSYGDRYWAVYEGLKKTLYSSQSEKVCPGRYTR